MAYNGPQGQSLHHYEDWERPLAIDDWNETAGGSSTTEISTVTFFPERGVKSLEIEVDGDYNAYRYRDTGVSLSPGEDVYIGFWVYVKPETWDGTVNGELSRLSIGATALTNFYIQNNNASRQYFFNDAGGSNTVTTAAETFKTGRWNYIVYRLLRATTDVAADGGGALWVNGQFINQFLGTDNYDRCVGSITLLVGSRFGTMPAWDGFNAWFDEIKVADSYPQPYVPAIDAGNTDELYPTHAKRIAVLYRTTSDNSVALADYAVDEMGVPRSLLIPLPNATSTETAADRATFLTEVETDLLAWLALNTDAAAQIGTFATGFDMPNFFLDGGTRVSTALRLMNLDNAYSKQTANPFYQNGGRITFAELRAEGMYCCTALDCSGLGTAQGIIDNGLAVDNVRVSDGQNFQTDSAAIYALLSVQKTRLTRVLSPPPAASAAVLIGTLDGSETTSGELRLIGDIGLADTTIRSGDLVTNLTSGWPVAVNGLAAGDYASFFEAFHTGGTFEKFATGAPFAEALLSAWPYVDYEGIAVGMPNMRILFSWNGYNVYRGVGSPLAVDYDNAVAYVPRGDTDPSLVGLGHAADTVYYYAIRPVRNGCETPDIECIIEFATDGAGDWTGDRPVAVENLQLEQQSGAVIRVMWYSVPGNVAPTDFGIWYGTSKGVDTSGAPDATASLATGEFHQHDLSLVDGQAYWIAVAARKDTVPGEAVEAGPLLADSTPPAAPGIYTS